MFLFVWRYFPWHRLNALYFCKSSIATFFQSIFHRLYFKEKPSLKITFPCSGEQDYYLDKHRIIICTRIENTSSLPIIIYEFELNNNEHSLFSSSLTNAKGVYFIGELKNSKRFSLNLERDQIKLPLTIQAYGLVEGFAFFLCCMEDDCTSPFPIVFKAHTTRVIFSGTTEIGQFFEIDEYDVKNISIENL